MTRELHPHPNLRTPAFTVAVLLAFFPSIRGSAQTITQPPRTPVLVELFTSEGCSSCPPADALLAKLLQQQPVPTADIIVLEEHVDYWESLGWHDRFSAHQFTDRQSAYTRALHLDDNYTPQMVVDGTAQFVGNDAAHALRAITQAAHTSKPILSLSALTIDAGHISASVSTSSPSPLHAELYAALIDSTASTHVASGENGGRTLTHVSVVRSMQRVGSLDALTRGPLAFTLPIPKDSIPANLRVVVFAQRVNQGSVVAATSSAGQPQPPPIRANPYPPAGI